MELKPGRLKQGALVASSAVFLWLALALPATAQIPGLPNSNTAAAPTPPEEVRDRFGRSTPRGTIVGFTRAVHIDNFVGAGRFLQVANPVGPKTEALARNLNEVMDRYFQQPILSISDSPEGAVNDGLPIDREKVGPLEIGGEEIFIGLERVKDPDAGQIWLISSETIARVPAMYGAMEKPWVERVMPEVLLKVKAYGISAGQLIAWAGSVGIPLLLLSLASAIGLVLARKLIQSPTRRRLIDSWYDGLRWPIIFVLTLGVHVALLSALGLSLRFRIVYSRTAAALLIAALAWLISRLLSLSFDYMNSKMYRREQAGAKSLMLLGERAFQVLILVIAAFSILGLVGVETSTVLAGLGILGVAVAFGAQKTVENFIGGVFLLLDKAIAVGDMCRISNQLGFVEDITLRSVRLRTLEQTLVSVPAGALSQHSIENFTTRGKILAQTTLRLRYGTSAEQLRSVLSRISRLLAENPRIETQGSRVRLVDFGVRAVEIELFAYVLTTDFAEFLALREELLLQIAAIVEASGSGFARPEIVEVGPQPTAAEEKQRVH